MRNNLPGGSKFKFIFAVLCILIGVIVYVNFDSLDHWRFSIWGVEILHYCTKTFGRYGCSGFYIVGGIVFAIKGIFELKSEKEQESK